jgi:hypothetical protein
VLDLQSFNSTLRLHWQWYKWKEPHKPWSQMKLNCSATEIALFRAYTKVAIGDGKTTKFWEDSWLQGQCPKELAPALHKLAWRKNYTVCQGMEDGKWMRGLQRISTLEEINQFVHLWHKISYVNLTNHADDISWRFTANGTYTTRSAYSIQFAGSFADYEWEGIWRAKVENKCKLFCWLIMQNKLWTADRLIKHGGQANTICQLCRSQQESALHLLAQCSYSQLVWSGLSAWLGASLQPPPTSSYRRLRSWWNAMIQAGGQGPLHRQERVQKLIYTAWNLWKERCRRAFDNKVTDASNLQSLIRSDVLQWRLAWSLGPQRS